MTTEERIELADRLNEIWAVLRHVRASDLPPELAVTFDGSYADDALRAARYVRPDDGGTPSPRKPPRQSEETMTYRTQFAGSGPFIRIIADDGDTKREIATCTGRGSAWPQAVKDAELIVAALNAYQPGEGAVAALREAYERDPEALEEHLRDLRGGDDAR